MPKRKAELIVALDVDTLEETRRLIELLSPVVNIFKVGSQLFTACGPAAVRFIQAKGKKPFLDLKFHDIPNTVANAVNVAVSLNAAINLPQKQQQVDECPSLYMYTLHTQGGAAMLIAAVEAGTKTAREMGVKKPLTLGITVLTSAVKKDNILQLVVERALLAKKCGLDGVVASSQEAQLIRQELGEKFIIVTPGIRLPDQDSDDQQRIATPFEAVKNGSDYLVVGRPIVKSEKPLEAAKFILNEIRRAQ